MQSLIANYEYANIARKIPNQNLNRTCQYFPEAHQGLYKASILNWSKIINYLTTVQSLEMEGTFSAFGELQLNFFFFLIQFFLIIIILRTSSNEIS